MKLSRFVDIIYEGWINWIRKDKKESDKSSKCTSHMYVLRRRPSNVVKFTIDPGRRYLMNTTIFRKDFPASALRYTWSIVPWSLASGVSRGISIMDSFEGSIVSFRREEKTKGNKIKWKKKKRKKKNFIM